MNDLSIHDHEQQRNTLTLEIKRKGVDALISCIVNQSVQIEELSQKLEHQEQRIQFLQDLLDITGNLESLEPDTFCDRVILDAEAPLRPEYGFHDLEYDKRGLPYRWTGPDRKFKFNLHLLRDTDHTLTLNILNFSLKRSREITGWVNNRKIDWTGVEKQGEYTSYTTTLPKLKNPNVATTLIFEAPGLYKPQEENPDSKDSRTLGIAFYSLIAD